MGTFIYVLFFMICTDKNYQYSNDKVLNCLVSASSYVTAKIIAGGPVVTMGYGPLFNPAIAFGYALFAWNFDYPQYIFMPFVGSIVAVLFYEFVFVKTQMIKSPV